MNFGTNNLRCAIFKQKIVKIYTISILINESRKSTRGKTKLTIPSEVTSAFLSKDMQVLNIYQF